MSILVEKIIAALSEVHVVVPPDIDQRTAAYWWGAQDDSVAWWLAMCRTASRDQIAQSLYLAHVAEDFSSVREIKQWAYGAAHDIANEKRRHRKAVESYSPTWGHQAARDGVALALWAHFAEMVPGYAARSRAFKCRAPAYLAIRDGVERKTRDAINAFRTDMTDLSKGFISQDFRRRFERGASLRGEECDTKSWGNLSELY